MRISDWSSDVCSSDLMRMQRIDKLFAPLPRIVRDVAQEMGKKIAFQKSGGEVELDREMMENIRDPLIHIVRNAIDHGVEPLADRVAAGKEIPATIGVWGIGRANG